MTDVVDLRPLEVGDADELRRIHALPGVARWWDAPPEGFPPTPTAAAGTTGS